MTSRFIDVPFVPTFDYETLNNAYLNDPNPNKVDLVDGVYKDENGRPWVLPVIRQVERMMAGNHKLNHQYLPSLGLESFSTMALSMLFGSDNPILKEERAFSVQCLSGTGAIRVGAEFLAKVCKYTVFYCSEQTWDLHEILFKNSGFKVARKYRYWDQEKRCLNFDGLLEDLRAATENSVVILHATGHNPTACDPTRKQWELIADVCEERGLFPFFDFAYQGFVSGDMDTDAWVIRYFASRNIEMFVAQSFAKSFSLYDERIGHLVVVTKTKSVVPQMKSNFKMIIDGMYLSPPHHGARIVATILSDPKLTAKWKDSVSIMAKRIKEMRKLLVDTLKQMNTPGSWDHITAQVGMFAYTGLTRQQVEHMIQKHHVYLHWNGRLNVCGITKNNVKYVAAAIHDSIINYPDTNSEDQTVVSNQIKSKL